MMELREYMFKERLTEQKFSDMLGCSRNHLHAIKNKRLRPGMRLAKDIERLTDGKVTVAELRPEK